MKKLCKNELKKTNGGAAFGSSMVYYAWQFGNSIKNGNSIKKH